MYFFQEKIFRKEEEVYKKVEDGRRKEKKIELKKKAADKEKYFHYNTDDHWKWNCPTYLATLKNKKEIGSDSTSWGNYYNTSFTYYTNTSKSTATKASKKSVRIPSGAYEGANANNVFDLAGNVYDWTLEPNISENGAGRVGRGTSYNSASSAYASSRAGEHPSNNAFGFRCTLYIK